MEDTELIVPADLLEEHIIATRREVEEQLNQVLFEEFLQENKEILVNPKIQFLSNMFPDADLDFLENLVKESNNDDELLNHLTETQLLNGTYPKKHRNFERKKQEKEISYYTTNFNVENFIAKFPEPFIYFENPFKNGLYDAQVLKLLKEKYNHQPASEVEKIYESKRYNLSLTIKYFDDKFTRNESIPFTIETKNLALLQEIAFINNKALLKKRLNQIKKEKSNLELYKDVILFECNCCFEEGLKFTEAVLCEYNHQFCKKCIIQASNIAIAKKENFKCLYGCDYEFPLSTLNQILPLDSYKTLEQIKQYTEISAAHLENLEFCPFCSYAMVIEEKINIFKCGNPVCMTISCRLCKNENHLPLTCREVRREHANRLLLEEELSDEVIRKCYNCKKAFIKESGCNKVTCFCGANICYICRKPITGYEHFAQCKLHT